MTSEITRNEYPDLFRHFEEGKQLEDLMGESGAVWPILSLVLVGLVLGSSFWLFLNTAIPVPGPEGFLFWFWHGSW